MEALREKEQAMNSELYAKRQEVSQLEQTNNGLLEEIQGLQELKDNFDQKLQEAQEFSDFTIRRQRNENKTLKAKIEEMEKAKEAMSIMYEARLAADKGKLIQL